MFLKVFDILKNLIFFFLYPKLSCLLCVFKLFNFFMLYFYVPEIIILVVYEFVTKVYRFLVFILFRKVFMLFYSMILLPQLNIKVYS